ncbi:MAG: ABC transporter permease, partial [Proteobacteria bacterium]|nr:ABC transporter permease [Pseudomonadota bacterium]
PVSKKLTQITDEEKAVYERRTKVSTAKFLSADIIGVLVTTKPGQVLGRIAKEELKDGKRYLQPLQVALFIAANLGLGLFISTAVKTQFQAMQMTFFLIMPSILLSGFIFPFEGMPVFAQFLGEALPITHFIRLTRGIMLRDAGLGDMPGAMIYLGTFTLVVITAAALRFSKRLD